MLIRRLEPAHAARYRALMLDAYANHPDAFTSTVAERAALPMSWWEGRLAASAGADAIVFGALDGDLLCGAAGLLFETRERTRHKATLVGMMVSPAQRGRGIGRGLVEAVLAGARERPGVRVVQLTVTDGNAAAQALYARCGFVPFGVEPMAVATGDGFVAKVHMWRDVGI